jgi:hypothetical protein
MSTGSTSKYALPYPISTDPVNVSGDIEQLAEKIDNSFQEIIEDTSADMWTGGTFSNGINTPTYNDNTGKMSMSLSQDLRSSASPNFVNLTLAGDAEVNGGDITTSQTAFNLINTNATSLNIGGAATTISIGNNSGQINSAADFNIAELKVYKINNASVLSASALGSGVVSSSLTGVGNITTGVWNATTIAVNKGGTGLTSYVVGDIVYASASATLTRLAGVATGNALISGGVGAAPSWGKIGLTTHVSGTLPVANGGTGITSFGSGIATWLGTPSSANLAAAITDETGSGALVFASGPSFSGIPTAPTAANGTNTTQIATTQFVQTAVSTLGGLPSQTGQSGKFLTTNGTVASWGNVPLPNNGTLTLNTSGTGISGSQTFTADQATNATFTVTLNSSTSGTANTIALRNASGGLTVTSPTAAGSKGVREVTMSTSSPSGGADGDMWLVYQ